MNSRDTRRLFVPLSAEPFEWFCNHGKRWELRRYGRQYTKKHLVPGRPVELRRGYSSRKDAIWGRVDEIVEAETLREFFHRVPFHQVIPSAQDADEALLIASRILRTGIDEKTKVIGFKIALDDAQAAAS